MDSGKDRRDLHKPGPGNRAVADLLVNVVRNGGIASNETEMEALGHAIHRLRNQDAYFAAAGNVHIDPQENDFAAPHELYQGDMLLRRVEALEGRVRTLMVRSNRGRRGA